MKSEDAIKTEGSNFWRKSGSQFILWLTLNLLASSLCLVIQLIVAILCGKGELWDVVNLYAYNGGFASAAISSVMSAFYLFFNNLLDNHLTIGKAVVLVFSLLLYTLNIVLYTNTLFNHEINTEFHWNVLLVISVVLSIILSILAFVMTHREDPKKTNEK